LYHECVLEAVQILGPKHLRACRNPVMNILIWNSWITPAGGMERVALSLANGLANCPGANVFLAGPYDQVPVLRSRIDPKVRFLPCDFQRRADVMLRNALFLRRIVREHKIDVVSAHGSLIPLLPVSVPVAWTEHGPRYGDQPVFKGARTLPWMGVKRRLLSGDWKLVGCSRYVCDRLCGQFGLEAEDAAVILNGVPDAERLRGLEPPRFDEPFRLGFLGRLEPEKFPLDIFELDRELQARGVSCEWNVFGKGSLEGEMRKRAESVGRVKVRGLAAHPAEAFSEMDALVFLSHGQMEGLPTVILESRLARRPVIAWNVTANPEAAGPTDELVEPFDLAAFADAICRVLDRRSASPEAGSEISYDRMIDEYWKLLGSLCRRQVGAERFQEVGQS